MGGMVLGGAVFYEATEAERILQGYVRLTSAAPDEFTTQALLVFAPPAPFIPPALLVAIGERKHAFSPIRS